MALPSHKGAEPASASRHPREIGRWKLLLFVLGLFVLSGCGVTRDRDPAIGEAFAGPSTLSLRTEIDPKSPVAAIVHHGEKLAIIAQRRRFYKVRTAKGIEGWTQDSGLLDSLQMSRLRNLAKDSAELPSQGVATAFDPLRVHAEPNRLSPSFLQIAAGEKIDVVQHKVTTRAAPPKRQLIQPRPKIEKKIKSKGKSSSYPPPPRPEPPAPPKDWVALSKQSAAAPEEDQPPAAHDDWTLIRTKAGQSGWVLTSRLYMAIPDEVAQYAEGHRITSYFSLGKIHDLDLDQDKDIWLWTTAASLGEDHDFDGYRVFVWNTRRHRYETAYIQRRERGFFPVLAHKGEFSVCLEDDEGVRTRRQYVLVGNLVRPSGQTSCAAPSADEPQSGQPAHIVVHEAPAKPTFYARMKEKFKSMFGR